MIKCIIFDLWGTLTDDNPSYNGKEIVPKMFGLERKVFTRFLRFEWGTRPDWTERDFFAAWLLKIKKAGDEKLLEKLLEIWEKHYDAVTIFEDTKSTLEELRQQGYRLGLLSNTEPTTYKVLDRLDLNPRRDFDFVVFSYEYKLLKPSKEIFQLAIQKAGCSPQEILMVGDKFDLDIFPARQLGMRTVWLDRARISGASAYPADFKITSLTELPEILKKI